MKRVICAALCLLFLCSCAVTTDAPELLEPIKVGNDIAQATVGNVFDGSVIEGNIIPEIEKLSFSTSGTVQEVYVCMGDVVKEGDPLVKLDTSAMQARRDALADQVEYAKTMDEFSTREAALTAKQMGLQFGEDSPRCLLYINEQKEAAKKRTADIEALEMQLEEAEDALNVQSVLSAPFDGTVASVSVSVGDMVRPNATIAVVANDSTCYLQTEFFTETAVAAATEVYATVGGVRYEVTYVPMDINDYISQSLSNQTMYAKFEIEDGNSDLVGQYALLYLMTIQQEQVLNVPSNAVLRDSEGYYVYVDQNGVKERRPVEVGVVTTAQAEIVSGLQEGESVYVVS